MKVYKIGDIWHYKFMFRGKSIRKSTRQTNHKVACDMASTHRSNLAKGMVGIIDQKPAPTLAAFAKEFLTWAAAEFHAKPKTLAYYQNSVAQLLKFPPLMSLQMSDSRILERLTDYKGKRQRDGLAVASVNHELRCVRRLLRLAVEWGRIESVPKVKLLSGESHRERVISREEEARYLVCAPPLLAAVAVILFDSGARPEEAFRLGWQGVRWDDGRNGTLFIDRGKTKAARRVIPMTARVRAILEARWRDQGQPLDGWVFPVPNKSGHLQPSGVRKQHLRALRESGVAAFVLYSARHTFLTRLGSSGCDAWTLARIAGHSSIQMSLRYVHAGNDRVLDVMTSHEFGQGRKTGEEEKQLTA